ncbi:peptidylprolyl isomerase FKBP-type [Mucilaginibacter paludis DSM 18603]|uniref:Peptidyl-prolyl cis-trans isomerase n=2 Tax=Mucilaginibacter TaxID=423349 RepID=H1Y3G7_9SPHI|nr:peptidylprolyl isomerase FKBP-type [Mucilaginibacter paludis DSM 18603]
MNLPNSIYLSIFCIVFFVAMLIFPKISKSQNVDTVSYLYGNMLGKSLASKGVEKLNFDLLLEGVKDGIVLKSRYPDSITRHLIRLFESAAWKSKYEANIKLGERFLFENQKKENVIVTPSGLQYQIIKLGKGEIPKPEDVLTVNYKGELVNGLVFDNSYDRGQPVIVKINQVIKGWKEILQLMPFGSKFRVFIPYQLGYGVGGTNDIPPYSTLIFELELISLVK